MTTLSERLRDLADEVEGDPIDEVPHGHLSFRYDEDVVRESDVVHDIEDAYDGTVLATVFTTDI